MKRFTETGKWEKPWFQDLPPHLKCLWLYICDKADCAGVWEMNWKMASLSVGKTLSESDLKYFAGRVAVFSGKLVIGSFIEFQYGKLSPDCRPHVPIFRAIEKHRVSVGYSKATSSLKEQEQDKEKDKEQEKDKEKEPEQPAKEDKARGTIEEISAFCHELALPQSDADSCFNKWEGNGWKNAGQPIKSWKSTIRSWKASGYLPSQKNGPSNRRTEADRDRERTGFPEDTRPLKNVIRGSDIIKQANSGQA